MANPGGDNEAGETYVVFGSGDGFAASLNLSSLDGSNGFRLDGIDADDLSGGSVSATPAAACNPPDPNHALAAGGEDEAA